MKTISFEKKLAYNRIKGNDLLKRSVEIALIGQHSITIVGNSDNGLVHIQEIFKSRPEYSDNDPICNENLLTFVSPCLCGNYGDTGRCDCSIEEIKAHTRSYSYRSAMRSHIIVALERPLFSDIVSVVGGESFQDVMERIHSFDRLRTINSIDNDAMDLLKTAYDRLLFTGSQVERVLTIVRTIALMDNLTIVKAYHMSEAIQYQIFK